MSPARGLVDCGVATTARIHRSACGTRCEAWPLGRPMRCSFAWKAIANRSLPLSTNAAVCLICLRPPTFAFISVARRASGGPHRRPLVRSSSRRESLALGGHPRVCWRPVDSLCERRAARSSRRTPSDRRPRVRASPQVRAYRCRPARVFRGDGPRSPAPEPIQARASRPRGFAPSAPGPRPAARRRAWSDRRRSAPGDRRRASAGSPPAAARPRPSSRPCGAVLVLRAAGPAAAAGRVAPAAVSIRAAPAANRPRRESPRRARRRRGASPRSFAYPRSPAAFPRARGSQGYGAGGQWKRSARPARPAGSPLWPHRGAVRRRRPGNRCARGPARPRARDGAAPLARQSPSPSPRRDARLSGRHGGHGCCRAAARPASRRRTRGARRRRGCAAQFRALAARSGPGRLNATVAGRRLPASGPLAAERALAADRPLPLSMQKSCLGAPVRASARC